MSEELPFEEGDEFGVVKETVKIGFIVLGD